MASDASRLCDHCGSGLSPEEREDGACATCSRPVAPVQRCAAEGCNATNDDSMLACCLGCGNVCCGDHIEDRYCTECRKAQDEDRAAGHPSLSDSERTDPRRI